MLSETRFLEVYVPLAKEGATAKEIAKRLGVSRELINYKVKQIREKLQRGNEDPNLLPKLQGRKKHDIGPKATAVFLRALQDKALRN
jgi:DNA-binding NarL/FixJ family response regulator